MPISKAEVAITIRTLLADCNFEIISFLFTSCFRVEHFYKFLDCLIEFAYIIVRGNFSFKEERLCTSQSIAIGIVLSTFFITSLIFGLLGETDINLVFSGSILSAFITFYFKCFGHVALSASKDALSSPRFLNHSRTAGSLST